MRKYFYHKTNDVILDMNTDVYKKYSIALLAKINFFRTWEETNDIMTWATRNKKWYMMGHNEIKQAFEKHAPKIFHLPPNCSEVGFTKIRDAYAAFVVKKRIILRKHYSKLLYKPERISR